MTEPSALETPQMQAVAQQAIMKHPYFEGGASSAYGFAGAALKAVAAALRTAPAQGEPVAWRVGLLSGKYQLTQERDIADTWRNNGASVEPLYAALPSSPAPHDAPPGKVAELDRLSSLWEDERIRHNVYKDYFELAHVIDILLGRIPR